MPEKLMHGSSEMQVEPINIPLTEVAQLLKEGDPVVVILEPGDATRYRLLIVPCWSCSVGGRLGDIGIPLGKETDYLMVTKFDNYGGNMFFATEHVQHWDAEALENEWSRDLVTWWVRRLWKVISHSEK